MTPETLDALFPAILAWVQTQENLGNEQGRPLNEWEREQAIEAGVIHADEIRIREASRPLGEEPLVLDGIEAPKELSEIFTGMFACPPFRYSLLQPPKGGPLIFGIATALNFQRMCRHIYQFEQLGAYEIFLRTYLEEVLQYGSLEAPMCKEATTFWAIPRSTSADSQQNPS